MRLPKRRRGRCGEDHLRHERGGVQVLYGAGRLPPGGVRLRHRLSARQRLRPEHRAHGAVHSPRQRPGWGGAILRHDAPAFRRRGISGELEGLSGTVHQRISRPAQGNPYHGHPLRQRLPAHQGQRLPHPPKGERGQIRQPDAGFPGPAGLRAVPAHRGAGRRVHHLHPEWETGGTQTRQSHRP